VAIQAARLAKPTAQNDTIRPQANRRRRRGSTTEVLAIVDGDRIESRNREIACGFRNFATWRGGLSMKPVARSFAVGVLAALSGGSGAMAQSPYYDDLACRQYADAQIAPMRDQANANAVGSTLLGAGLGAALGGAIGGGRGAGIGAASGAIVGAGSGAAQAQYDAGYLQQQYDAYYGQCMSARSASYGTPPPGYGAPPPGYAQQPGYAPAAPSTASQLNQQQLNQGAGAPAYPGYPPPPR
jgi:hypothetical protein